MIRPSANTVDGFCVSEGDRPRVKLWGDYEVARSQGRELERKKLLGDPILVMGILLIMAFLLLFIVYPLWTVTAQSFSRSETETLDEVKAAGEWFVKAAEKLPEAEAGPFRELGVTTGEFHRFYNRYRRNNADDVVKARNALNNVLAQVDGAAIEAFAGALKLPSEEIRGRVETIREGEATLGHPAFSPTE